MCVCVYQEGVPLCTTPKRVENAHMHPYRPPHTDTDTLTLALIHLYTWYWDYIWINKYIRICKGVCVCVPNEQSTTHDAKLYQKIKKPCRSTHTHLHTNTYVLHVCDYVRVCTIVNCFVFVCVYVYQGGNPPRSMPKRVENANVHQLRNQIRHARGHW